MKKMLIALSILILVGMLNAVTYKIELTWDEFEGELNGVLTGTYDEDTGFVQGVGSESALDGKIVSLGEDHGANARQTFEVRAEDGLYSFWIRDKFADQDINADMELIANAKPKVVISRDDFPLETIEVPQSYGLVCKVFTLDAGSGEVDREIRYFPKNRIIMAQAVHAVTGDPLPDVKVSASAITGSFIELQEVDNGVYVAEVETGDYELSFHKEGFIPVSFKVNMGFDENPREVICAMTPELKDIRIVLTWGSRPKDLDAHLSGPDPDGGDFHIWYRHRVLVAGRDFLDRDDTSSYGPETITIYKPAQGEYYYAVHDYSNRHSKRSKRLSASGARVQVYGDGRLLNSFEVPRNKRGTVWHVFKIDKNNQVVPTNTVDYVDRGEDIR